MACGQTLGRAERGQGGKCTQRGRDGRDLLERWLSVEGRGCCGGEPAFPARRVSAAVQLGPLPRSVRWSASAACCLLKSLLKSQVRAVAGNFSTAANSDLFACICQILIPNREHALLYWPSCKSA